MLNIEKQKFNSPRVGEVLISQQEIADRVAALADQIICAYDNQKPVELVIVAIMTGSMIFLADLVRAMPLPVRIAIMMVSSYPGASTSSQGVKVHYDVKEDIAGKDVLVVDDILDSGKTLHTVVGLLKKKNPKSVRTCVFLDKILSEPKLVEPDFTGFKIPNKFVVGYGLDYDNLFRNYPQIAILDI